MGSDPSDGRSYVVMARLLVLCHRSADAEALLVEFLERYPGNAIAREALDRLQADANFGATAAAFNDERNIEIREGSDRDDPPIPPPGAPQELLLRGGLTGEFSRARIAMDRGLAAPTTDLIRRESRKGDPLAGFHSQWLMPKDTPECPPHAWAWRACRCWQESASPEHWRSLAAEFPEAAPETELLRALDIPDDGDPSGVVGWQEHHSSGNNSASRPVDVFMRKTQERLVGADPSERGELAGTVMACAASGALDVMWRPAA